MNSISHGRIPQIAILEAEGGRKNVARRSRESEASRHPLWRFPNFHWLVVDLPLWKYTVNLWLILYNGYDDGFDDGFDDG